MRHIKLLLVISTIIASCIFPQKSYAIQLFDYSFADDAFSDDAKLIDGQLSYWGFSKWGYPVTGNDSIDLPVALNGSDLYTAIEGKLNNSNVNSPYIVDVEFIDNYLFNGDGADLVLWERGQPEPMRIALFDPRVNDWTQSNYYQPVKVGELNEAIDITSGVNAAEVDFSFWGIPGDVQINRIRLISDFNYSSPDVAAFGGLNSKSIVPEPATVILFGAGLVGISFRRKKK